MKGLMSAYGTVPTFDMYSEFFLKTAKFDRSAI